MLVITLLSFGASAQETTSEIQGTVSNGKSVLAGARITAVHTPTGTKYTTTTRQDGRYNLANLKIGGPYLVTVSYVGFQEGKDDDITLNLGQPYNKNFVLVEKSSNLKEVVVNASKTAATSKTGLQQIISRRLIEQFPTVTRSWKDVVKLVPSNAGGAFGGISSQLNNITLDGANFNNSFGLAADIGGQTGQQAVSLDAIEQIQVNVSPYDVKLGGFAGTGINTITKSGTNKVKGSVYEYSRNENYLKIGRAHV